MFRRTKLLLLAVLVAAQVAVVAAPAMASEPLEESDDGKCLVWIWIDGWRCAVP